MKNHLTHLTSAAFAAHCLMLMGCQESDKLRCVDGTGIGFSLEESAIGTSVLVRSAIRLKLSENYSLTDENGRELAFPVSVPVNTTRLHIRNDGVVFADLDDGSRLNAGQIVTWKLGNKQGGEGRILSADRVNVGDPIFVNDMSFRVVRDGRVPRLLDEVLPGTRDQGKPKSTANTTSQMDGDLQAFKAQLKKDSEAGKPTEENYKNMTGGNPYRVDIK